MTAEELEQLYLLYVESKGGAINHAQEEEMAEILHNAFPERDPKYVSFDEARAALGI